jgi:Aminoglycoside-2''-adenylyltransferase
VRSISGMEVDLGEWAPLTVPEIAELFTGAPFRWWIGGGHALELSAGRSWRPHGDVDVGICRRDAAALRSFLHDWDLHVASGGQLTPWNGEPLRADLNQNNVWCRRSLSSPWSFDATIGEGDDDVWIYRRDPSLRLPWDEAVLLSDDGIPFLAPDLQLLFRSKNPGAKDDEDAGQVIGSLSEVQRNRLAGRLPPDHPWGRWLA